MREATDTRMTWREMIARFLGARIFTLMIVAIVASIGLAAIDVLVMTVLQLLLKSVGLVPPDARQFGPFAGLSRSPVTIALLLASVGVLRGLAQWVLALSAVASTENLTMRLRRICLFEMLRSRANHVVSAATANFRINEVFPKAATFIYHVTFFVAYAAQSAMLLVLMTSAAPREAVIALIGLAVIGVVARRVDKKVHGISLILPHEQQKLISGIERISRNWFLVKILGTDESEFESLRDGAVRYGQHFIRANAFSQFGGALPITLGTTVLVMIVVFNLTFWHTPGLKFVAFLYFFLRFIQSLGTLVATWGLVIAYREYFRRTYAYFISQPADEVLAALDDGPAPAAAVPARVSDIGVRRPPTIDVRNLHFRYEGSPHELFEGLDLTVPGGTCFGIVGRSGTGKSTLLALILGLLRPNEGSVAIDGLSPNDFLSSTESNVGYVGAEPFIIEGTIKNNLDYGRRREYDLADYEAALSSARLLDFVRANPAGLDYRLQENGDGLSAGQKQRLGLARALIAQPRLLILDEASANLDVQTETEIAASIHALKGDTTVLIVSHRLGILRNVDGIFDLSTHSRGSGELSHGPTPNIVS